MSLMESRTMHKISYGMYIVSSKLGDKYNGQVANTVFQITSEPPTIAVSINKENLTHQYIKESKRITVSILGEDTPMTLIGTFGFKTGRELDKFKDLNFRMGQVGVPILEDYCLGFLEGEVIQEVEMATHTIFIARVTGAEITSQQAPMTYAYYHLVKKGKAPKTAPTYLEEEMKTMANSDKYVCTVCGYVYDPELGDSDGGIAPGTPFEDIPDDWVCPVCGVGKDQFEKQG